MILASVSDQIKAKKIDCQQSMEMLKSNNIRFIGEHVGELQIFRDKKLINFYYCTEAFKTLIEINDIKGLKFEEVGKTLQLIVTKQKQMHYELFFRGKE